MCCQNKMKAVAITFCIITILLIALVVVLPIVLKNKIKSDYTDKTKPELSNVNLWAKFPGDIKAQTTHTFNILDYSNQDTAKIKDSLVLEEEIAYENFKNLDDKLIFDAKSQYKVTNTPKSESINTLNLGMFEALETIANPPLYQKGINSLEYLLNKALPNPEVFTRQILAYNLFNTYLVDETKVRTNILYNIPSDKANKILSNQEEYSKYSFKNLLGFYEWMKIIGKPDEIKNAQWLSDIFGLSSSEIESIIGSNSYLYTYFVDFFTIISAEFKCEKRGVCGKELLIREIVTGGVLKFVNFEGGLLAFYQIFQREYYPYSKSPEMDIYFEEYKKKINKEDIKFEDYAPTFEQFNSLVNSSFSTCLLASNNSVLFLSLNKSDNVDKSYQYFKISKNVLYFLSDYIYDYLPRLFLYQEFEDKGEVHKIHPIAKAYAAITQNSLSHSYKILADLKGIFNLILSKFVWDELLDQLFLSKNRKLKAIEPDEICPLIMQTALDDGKKVLKVCSDPQTSFNSAGTLYKWFAPYYCITGEKTDCDMTIINYLKTIIYITDDEIKSIYDKTSLGEIFEKNDKLLRELYECGDNCDDDELLLKKQFWKSDLTKKLPEPFTSNTISTLFPDLIPYPVEMPYFAEKAGESVDIAEEDIDYLISLCPKGENILSEESMNVLITRFNLEKELTLKIESNQKPDEKKYSIMNLLNKGYIFNKDLNSNYKNLYSIIGGNAEEDQKYVQYLSQGLFFENFKPKFNKTTGFNFGIDFPSGQNKSIEYDRYGLYKNQKNDRDILRRIISMNDCPLLNIKKSEYNCLSDSYTIINSPTMNFQTLTGDKYFIDGFQYKAEEEPIYFYDKISSRPFKFDYEDDIKLDGISCKKYELDIGNLANDINEEVDSKDKKAFLTQKLNKPFMISVGNKGLNSTIEDKISEENYILVEPFTNMVLESKINFVYSIYTKQYGFINAAIDNDKTMPIFIYQRYYHVDMDSFKDYFPKIKNYNTFRKIFLIAGIILIVICAGISLWAFIKIHKKLIKEDISNNYSCAENINNINSSRDPTLMNQSNT